MADDDAEALVICEKHGRVNEAICYPCYEELVATAARLWAGLDRARRVGGYAPHHCPGCDAGTDETFYDEPAPHHAGCWVAQLLLETAPS